MTLEEQIAQITDPQEFTRLCNTILTEKHGSDYQVIDGTRSDDGNDGYVLSEKRILAMHCPIKPERKTDAGYLKKIRDDISKAQKLRDSGAYDIESWSFVTPRKLSNKVIVEMRSIAESIGLNAIHQESTFLATELAKNKHLIAQFPYLQIHDVDSKLNEILELLKEKNIKEEQSEKEIDDRNIYRGETKNQDELDQVIDIRNRPRDENTKSELRALYYKSADSTVKLNAIIGLMDNFDPVEDDVNDVVQLCNEGIAITESINADSVKAHFLAQKGYLVSFIYSKLDTETAFKIMADNTIGFQTITEEYRQGVITQLKALKDEYDTAFSEAVNLTKSKNDYYTLAGVLVFIGNAAGQRGFYLNTLDVKDRAATERTTCRRVLLAAKEIYEAFNDELNVANALFNLANQIRFFGEDKEALDLANNSLTIAKKNGDSNLQQKAEWLIHTLVTGEIPDYLAGERRQ
ncbi:MAG: hypothetical protein ACJA0I_001080 [Gammaproteobacteria bacterium]|jgi:hypothetical protein